MTTTRKPPLFHRALDARAIVRGAGTGSIVIAAPHPDDETLGCGLLIGRAAKTRARLGVIALTDGQASHPGSARWPAAALGRLRRSELRRALARLGAGRASVRFMGWHDGRLAGDGRALALRRVLTALRPAVVVAASPADHHPDHQAGWALIKAALAGTRIPLVAYAVWSRADDATRVRDPALAAKRWAMRAHRSQVEPYITDDPTGFTFAPAVLARLVRGIEHYHC